MKKLFLLPFVLPSPIILAPSSAIGCSTCANAQLWTTFPPLLTWSWIIPLWLVSLIAIGIIFKQKVPLIPHPVVSLVIAAILIFFSLNGMGGLVFILLLPIPVISAIQLYRYRSNFQSKAFLRAYGSISYIGLIALVGSCIPEILYPTSRKPADIILKWEGTPMERVSFQKLESREPKSLDDYRRIVQNANDYAVTKAASRLAIIGDRNIDVPLLIDAMIKHRNDKYPYVADRLKDTLKSMTDLSLPDGASAEQWRKAWQKKITAQPTP